MVTPLIADQYMVRTFDLIMTDQRHRYFRRVALNRDHRLLLFLGMFLCIGGLWWRGLSFLEKEDSVSLSSALEGRKVIIETLETFGVTPPHIKLGSFPLIGATYPPHSMFPLISADCPLGVSCQRVIEALTPKLIEWGYTVVPPLSPSTKGRPLFVALAKGGHPALALRLVPPSPRLHFMIHVPPHRVGSTQALLNLNEHTTFSLDPMSPFGRQAYDHLSGVGRELYLALSLDHLSTESDESSRLKERRSDHTQAPLPDHVWSRLRALLTAHRHLIGVDLSPTVLSQLNRSDLQAFVNLLSELRLILSIHRSEFSPLIRSLAQVVEVRFIEIDRALTLDQLTQEISRVEAQFVIDGEVGVDVTPRNHDDLNKLSQWLEGLSLKGVHLLRLSELAL